MDTESKFSQKEISAFHKKIGLNVKKYRELKGLTQLQLTEEMEYKSVGLVSQAELNINDKHFNLEHLYKISKVLDVDICKLIE